VALSTVVVAMTAMTGGTISKRSRHSKENGADSWCSPRKLPPAP
jgi:hypothetical protein